jgi:integrase
MGKRLGQAHALPGKGWERWVEHFGKKAPRKYFYILVLIEALCVRVTQVCQLKVEDIDLRGRRVWLKPFKRHRGVWKPLVPSIVKTLKEWKKNEWIWPDKGYLFPSQHGSKKGHITKDIVARHVRKHRKTFVQKWSNKMPELQNGSQIRTHSGRRHAISEMAGCGIAQHIGMAWSQIDSPRVYQSYVDLDPAQVYSAILKHDRKRKQRR